MPPSHWLARSSSYRYRGWCPSCRLGISAGLASDGTHSNHGRHCKRANYKCSAWVKAHMSLLAFSTLHPPLISPSVILAWPFRAAIHIDVAPLLLALSTSLWPLWAPSGVQSLPPALWRGHFEQTQTTIQRHHPLVLFDHPLVLFASCSTSNPALINVFGTRPARSEQQHTDAWRHHTWLCPHRSRPSSQR